jgi:hypothetical protein
MEYLKLQQKYLESLKRKNAEPETNRLDECHTPEPNSRSDRIEIDLEEKTAKKDLGTKKIVGASEDYQKENIPKDSSLS